MELLPSDVTYSIVNAAEFYQLVNLYLDQKIETHESN